MANPRVHEIAAEAGVDAKAALRTLRFMGEYLKSASSSIAPPVARRLRAALGLREVVIPMSPGAGRLVDLLPAAMPRLVDAILASEPEIRRTLSVLRAAAPSRFLLHVGPTAAAAIAGRPETSFDVDELAAPRGTVAVRAGGDVLLLSWRLSDAELELSLLIVQRNGTVLVAERGRAVALNERFVARGQDEVAQSLAILARLPRVVPTRVEGGDPGAEGGPAARRRAPQDDGEVRIVYLTRGRGDAQGLRRAVQRTTRWIVRGHWREQWFPSAGTHRRIWISEHEAGASDGPLRERSVVYVLR